MLVECRVLLNQETIDEVHRLGGSLQYAIEDGLRVWLFAAHRREVARQRRSLAAKKAALTRRQQEVAKHMYIRGKEAASCSGGDWVLGKSFRRDDPPTTPRQS